MLVRTAWRQAGKCGGVYLVPRATTTTMTEAMCFGAMQRLSAIRSLSDDPGSWTRQPADARAPSPWPMPMSMLRSPFSVRSLGEGKDVDKNGCHLALSAALQLSGLSAEEVLGVVAGGPPGRAEELRTESVKRKRRSKMNKHKHRKRKKKVKMKKRKV